MNSRLLLEQVVFHPEKYPTQDRYPFNLALFQNMRRLTFTRRLTFFIGENGSGKSTLLEALSQKCGFHIWRGVERTRYSVNPYESKLHVFMSLVWRHAKADGCFFASDVFRNFAKNLDEWSAMDPGMLHYFGGKSLMSQSHGQSLMSLFRSRYRIPGLYLMDEPETALSPRSQLELLQILRDISRQGHAQFIIASHSPILLAAPDAAILHFGRERISPLPYEKTDYYRIYKDFLNNRRAYL